MPKLNREQLGAYQVFLPPIETQTLFEKQAQSIIEAEQRRHIVGDKLERIYSLLLHRLSPAISPLNGERAI